MGATAIAVWPTSAQLGGDNSGLMPVLSPAVPSLLVSIVSHGHGSQVQGLLEALASQCAHEVARVVLTQNVPEPLPRPPEGGWPFALQLVRNAQVEGFGANHNRALARGDEAFVCVLNPDVKLLPQEPFAALVQAAGGAGVGCAYPEQLDEAGVLQDSERALPTPWALLLRYLVRRHERRADWVNAACMVLPRAVWETIGGFDERYFLYCEDVDLCLRLRLAGWSLVRAQAKVVHAGSRASHRRLRHLAWHVGALVRLWRSPVYARTRLHDARAATSGKPG